MPITRAGRKRVLLLQNLKSGFGDAGIYDFVHALGRAGCEVVLRFLDGGTPGELLADAPGFDVVVAAGGDGTVSAIAYGLQGSGIPMLAYPAGTANLIAANLRMPTDPLALAEVALEGSPMAIDMGELECRGPSANCSSPVGFLMAAGAGFDASIMEGARDLKQMLGPGAYVVSAFSNLNPTVARFSMRLDGRAVETEGIAVLLANFARIQFDLPVTHDGDARDGRLEVVVLRTKSVAGLLPAVWAALLDRLVDHPDRSPSLEIHSASEIEIDSDPPLPLQFDGEVLSATTPLRARVLPLAATFLVRSGEERVDG